MRSTLYFLPHQKYQSWPKSLLVNDHCICVILLHAQFLNAIHAKNHHFSDFEIYFLLQLFQNCFETWQAQARNDLKQINRVPEYLNEVF